MAEAGHYEALRKERILQRKREWERLTGSAGSANYQSRGNSSQFNANESKVPMSYRQPQSAYTQGRTQNYEQELRKRYLPALPPINSGRTNQIHQYSHSRHATPLTASMWRFIEQDLHNKAKVLRNHNIVMGPMSAFEQEYKKRAYFTPNLIY